MKSNISYEVDVPVSVSLFVRPYCAKRMYEVISKAKPSILFISSDGPRANIPSDYDEIMKCREIFSNIDWQCQVYRLYYEENQGMYTIGQRRRELIWSKVDRCIFLEDDNIPCASYFRFCAENLEKYKDDMRIDGICGFNHMNKYELPNADYFFSAVRGTGSCAQWRRTTEAFDVDLKYAQDNYALSMLKEANPSFYRHAVEVGKTGIEDGHIPGNEFLYQLNIVLQNKLYIIPKYNMVSNIGALCTGTHTSPKAVLPKRIQKLYDSDTYDIDFPMKHPAYVIRDRIYEKFVYKILLNRKARRFSEKIYKAIMTLRLFGVAKLREEFVRVQRNKRES